MVRDYELMYIVRPELEDDAVRVAVKSVRAMIESQFGRGCILHGTWST